MSRSDIERILSEIFWTGEPGQIAAIKSATEELTLMFQQAGGETAPFVETCPECGLKADTLLHKFCTRRYCPTRP